MPVSPTDIIVAEKTEEPQSLTPPALRLTEDEQFALDMLHAAFVERFSIVMDGPKMVITVLPVSQIELVHPNKVTEDKLQKLLKTHGFRFADCTKEQIRLFLLPAYAALLDQTKFQSLCLRILSELTVNDLDLLETLLTHPNINHQIIEQITAKIFSISPEILMDNPTYIDAIQRILYIIFAHPISSCETKKKILLIPNFIEAIYDNNHSQEELIKIITAAKAADLKEEDLQSMFDNPHAFKTLIDHLDYISLLLSSDMNIFVAWTRAKDAMVK